MSEVKTVKLGDIADFIRGITFKKDQVSENYSKDLVACYRTKNIQKNLDHSDVWYVSKTLVKKDKQYLQNGDILISSANSYNLVGKCCWIDNLKIPSTFGGFVTVLRTNVNWVHPKYLYYWFSSDKIQATLRSFGNQTTNISNLNIARASELTIELPSLEQQLIEVKKRDIQQQIEQKRERQRELFEELSVVRYEKLFASSDVEWTTIGDIAEKVGSGATPKGGAQAYKNEGISLIRSMNVHDRKFVYDGLAHIDDSQAAALANVEVKENDILLNITGASVARCCIVPKDVLPARVNQHVAIIRLKPNTIEPRLLERYLTLPSTKKELLKIARSGGATREAITKQQIINFTSPLKA